MSGSAAIAPEIPTLDVPALFPRREFDRIAEAGRVLMSLQRRILARHFLPRMSRAEILAHFDLAPELETLIDWDRLALGESAEAAAPVARHDVLLDRGGRAWICELNVDSAVGGLEIGAGRAGDPCPALARGLSALAERHYKDRVVLLDWSSWRDRGLIPLQRLAAGLRARLPGLPVLIADETDYRPQRRDLVYRVFLADDARGDPEFLHALVCSGALLVSGFESELFSSKLWLSCFKDRCFRGWLTPKERALVDTAVPWTETVLPETLPQLLEFKNQLVFKQVRSCAGRGVVLGRGLSAEALHAALTEPGSGSWIAQRFVETARPGGLNIVYGLYELFGEPRGLLVRGHAEREIVNVGNGAGVGWAVPA